MKTTLTLLGLFTLGLLPVALGQANIKFEEDVDPFTDENKNRVHVLAEEQSLYSRTNALIWRCGSSHGYEVIIVSDEYLGGDEVPVVYRFDGGEAISNRWNDSTTGTAAFAYTSQRDQFTEQAVAGNEVVFGVTDYSGSRYVYTFRLAGLEGFLQRLGCMPDNDVSSPTFQPLRVRLPIAEAYGAVREAVDGLPFTEDLNVMYLEGLTVRFRAQNAERSVLTFEGENVELQEKIVREVSNRVSP